LLENNKLKHIGYKQREVMHSWPLHDFFTIAIQFFTVPYSILTNALVDSPITVTHVAELGFLAGELAIKHQGVRRKVFRNTKHLKGDLE
jgi:hypothetical protein